MSVHGGFDLTAFCSAVERGDAATQLQFYAPNARVRLTSLADRGRIERTLTGRDDVRPWIYERCSNGVTYHVRCHWLGCDEVMMTEECRGPDGVSLSASTAQVSYGLIASQSVVLIDTPEAEKADYAPGA